MDPIIRNIDQIILAGLSFYGDPFELSNVWTAENQIGQLWQRFMTCLDQEKERLGPLSIEKVTYEVHLQGKETPETGFFEVFVGFEVRDIKSVPFNFLIKVLPKATYAVFTIKGTEIASDWGQETELWMKENGYREAYPFSFQYYDHRFLGLDRIEESEIDVYVPIEKNV